MVIERKGQSIHEAADAKRRSAARSTWQKPLPPELTPENCAKFCVRFLGQNQGTRHERKETQNTHVFVWQNVRDHRVAASEVDFRFGPDGNSGALRLVKPSVTQCPK